jgi:hypothetical protein
MPTLNSVIHNKTSNILYMEGGNSELKEKGRKKQIHGKDYCVTTFDEHSSNWCLPHI